MVDDPVANHVDAPRQPGLQLISSRATPTRPAVIGDGSKRLAWAVDVPVEAGRDLTGSHHSERRATARRPRTVRMGGEGVPGSASAVSALIAAYQVNPPQEGVVVTAHGESMYPSLDTAPTQGPFGPDRTAWGLNARANRTESLLKRD
jgi:hypothetical protein